MCKINIRGNISPRAGMYLAHINGQDHAACPVWYHTTVPGWFYKIMA
jgi:hypothetical protein